MNSMDFVHAKELARIRPKTSSFQEDLSCIQVWNNVLVTSVGRDRVDDRITLWTWESEQLKLFRVLCPKGTIYDMNTIKVNDNSRFVLYGGSSEGHLQIWTTTDMQQFSTLWLTMENTNRNFTPVCVWNRMLVSHSLLLFDISNTTGMLTREEGALQHFGTPASCILAANANLLVTSHEVGQLTFWNQTAKERTFFAHRNFISCLCFWKDHVVSAAGPELKIWTLHGHCIRTLQCDDDVNCLCVWGDLLCCGCGFVSSSGVIDASVMIHCSQPLQVWSWDGITVPVFKSRPSSPTKKQKISVHDCAITHLVVWGPYLCSASIIDQRVCIWECMY